MAMKRKRSVHVKIAAILRRKKKDYYLKRLLPEILRSTIFLGTNAFCFIGLFCVWRKLWGYYMLHHFFLLGCGTLATVSTIETKSRKLLGHINILSVFIPCMTASYIALLLERVSRRSLLAVYMMNVAGETLWNMAAYRGTVKSIKHGEVLLFSCVMAVFMYLYKSKDGLKDSMLSGFRFFIGASELPPPELPPSVLELNQSRNNNDLDLQYHDSSASEIVTASPPVTSPSPPSSKKYSFRSSQSSLVSYFPPEVQVLIRRWRLGRKHALCRHKDSCMASIVEGTLRSFGAGYLIQASIKLLSSLPNLFRKPGGLLQAIKHRENFQLGAFLGTFVGLFKLINCVLRWTRNKESEIHGLISGFIAGWSMMFYKSSSIAMYMLSKCVEVLYLKGIDAKLLPYVKHADILIYTVSTALVFHATVFEPHNLRPAYWKFLLRITNGRFADMDRRLLDVFGTESSKMFPNFRSPLDQITKSVI